MPGFQCYSPGHLTTDMTGRGGVGIVIFKYENLHFIAGAFCYDKRKIYIKFNIKGSQSYIIAECKLLLLAETQSESAYFQFYWNSFSSVKRDIKINPCFLQIVAVGIGWSFLIHPICCLKCQLHRIQTMVLSVDAVRVTPGWWAINTSWWVTTWTCQGDMWSIPGDTTTSTVVSFLSRGIETIWIESGKLFKLGASPVKIN